MFKRFVNCDLVIWTQPSGPLCLWQCFFFKSSVPVSEVDFIPMRQFQLKLTLPEHPSPDRDTAASSTGSSWGVLIMLKIIHFVIALSTKDTNNCLHNIKVISTNPCHSCLGFKKVFNVMCCYVSVTYFGLENIAMSKVDVHQDQGGQHEDGQGQVR